jgi:N-acetylmuramoyl-L-alanine amidase
MGVAMQAASRWTAALRRARACAAAVALALAVPPVAAVAADLAAASIEVMASRSDETAVVVRFSRADAPPAPQVFVLADPDRVVADLPLTDWRIAHAPSAAGLVRGVRWGLAAPGRSRLVVDLAAPAQVISVAAAPDGDGAALTMRLRAEHGRPAAAGISGSSFPIVPSPDAGRRSGLVVAIDPGHGGVDPGALHGDLREKDVTLAMAQALAQALTARGHHPALTREADVFVSLSARLQAARRAGADALISLHADTWRDGSASGASVYTLSEAASDALAARLAARENDADRTALAAYPGLAPDLSAALIDIARRGARGASERLGAALIGALRREGAADAGRPLRAAAFKILRAPDIPSALIELGFLSNPDDRARLSDPVWRAAAAEAMAEAVEIWAAEGLAPGVLHPVAGPARAASDD